MKHATKLTALAVLAALSGCTAKQTTAPSEVSFYNPDGKLVRTEVRAGEKAWADAQLAKSHAECWESVTANRAKALPQDADPVTIMAAALVASNRALASTVSGEKPCEKHTNSGDVAVAKSKNKAEVSKALLSAVPRALGVVAGAATTINGQNRTADIAASGAENAGTSVAFTGDGNTTNTVSQQAAGGSSISDAGVGTSADVSTSTETTSFAPVDEEVVDEPVEGL